MQTGWEVDVEGGRLLAQHAPLRAAIAAREEHAARLQALAAELRTSGCAAVAAECSIREALIRRLSSSGVGDKPRVLRQLAQSILRLDVAGDPETGAWGIRVNKCVWEASQVNGLDCGVCTMMRARDLMNVDSMNVGRPERQQFLYTGADCEVALRHLLVREIRLGIAAPDVLQEEERAAMWPLPVGD
jgi:hypothetical protein